MRRTIVTVVTIVTIVNKNAFQSTLTFNFMFSATYCAICCYSAHHVITSLFGIFASLFFGDFFPVNYALKVGEKMNWSN
jgi:hypothetical protein